MRCLPPAPILLQRAGPGLAAGALVLLAACGPRGSTPALETTSGTEAAITPPIAEQPSERERLWELGTAAIDRQDWRAADAAFTRILEMDLTYAPALHNRAIVRLRAARFDDARADFEAALQHTPDDAALRRNAAIALHWLGLDTRAAALLGDLPATDDIELVRASLAIREDRIDDALAQLTAWEARVTEPTMRWRADLLRGVAHAARDDFDEALRSFDRAELAAPTAPAPALNRARALLALGRSAEGQVALRRYLELAGPDAPDRTVIEAMLVE